MNRDVRVIHRIGRRGLSTAVIEGMLATSAPILAVIDGDMQHDEKILPLLFAKVACWDPSRHRASLWATRLGQWALKTEITDPMSGFFVVNRTTLMAAIPKLSSVGFKILLDIVSSAPTALRVVEIPFEFRVREQGESKICALVAVEYLALIADKTIGRIVPLRLLGFLVVGSMGVIVHLTILKSALWIGSTFLAGQTMAVLTAMTFNFFLNNIFTYRDRRLAGGFDCVCHSSADGCQRRVSDAARA
jgi:dolichol-phosphate mannosyltransferase